MNTVHFSLGEDLGKRITEIAQEKFIYNADPEAAINVFTQSLCGFPKEMAVRCLTGKELKLVVQGDEIEVVNQEIDGYPQLNLKDIIAHWVDEFDEIYKIFERPLLDHTKFTKRSIIIPYSVRDIIASYEVCDDDPYEFLKEFILSEGVYEIEEDRDFAKGIGDIELYRMFRECKILFLKRAKVIEFVLDNRLVDSPIVSPLYFFNTIAEYEQRLYTAIHLGVKEHESPTELDRFLDAVTEINAIERLEPIVDNEYRDAIWLSPDGTMYGLNGEISNMLHNTIAEMLLQQGVINAGAKREETNPYVILEESGWVKIHGNWVMFEPNPFDKPRQFMTEEQVKALREYLNKHFHMYGKFGIKHNLVLTYQLAQMDKFAINNLFSY